MNTEEHQLVQEWRQTLLEQPPYIFPGDHAILDKILHDPRFISLHYNFDAFINSPDFGTSTTQLHLGQLPMPYVGDLARSDIFILMLNPGFGGSEYYVEEHSPDYCAAVIRSIRQENGNDEYPFFYLDPRQSWTEGGRWWQNKLKSLTRALVEHRGLSYQDALRHLAQRVSCLELLPYHSRSFKVSQKTLSQLGSVRLVRDFVRDVLLPKAERGEVTIIVTRKQAEWGLKEGKHVVVYGQHEARGAHLTLGKKPSSGGRAIAKRLGVPIHITDNVASGDTADAL